MRIAVDIRGLNSSDISGSSGFIFQLLIRIIKHLPDYHFILFSDKEVHPLFFSSHNVEHVIITPSVKNILTLKWWYDVKLTAALKSQKADVLLCLNGVCSLTTKVPQLLLVIDLPATNPQYKRRRIASLQKADRVVTAGNYIKNEIVERAKCSNEKIIVINGAADEKFIAIDWQQRKDIKQQFSEGSEYFLFIGNKKKNDKIIQLLKAFSLFKKRQKTSMKVLIVGEMEDKLLLEKLRTYKYRDDVKIIGDFSIEDYRHILAGAYALIFLSEDGYPYQVVQSLQSGVPVICCSQPGVVEITGDAVLKADCALPEDLAEQMKLIYKDENLRSTLIDKGKIRAASFSWQQTIERITKAIEEIAVIGS